MSKKPVVLIMAGGKGERFWPRSRRANPKQLQKVYSNRTLLEETILRAKTITDTKHIFIGCSEALKKAVLKTHKFPMDNFILEPEGRNTAPIIALAALNFEDKFPGSVHVVLSADHYIDPLAEFKKTMLTAIETANNGYLVTLGVKPTRPETGYGYIESVKSGSKTGSVSIQSFVEKPNEKKAIEFLKKGNYYWNSGIFIWKGSKILEEFSNHAPEILSPLADSYKSGTRLKKNFSSVPELPVDIAIMEKSKNLAMVPASFTWDDVGSWNALDRIVPADKNANIMVSENGKTELFGKDSSGNIIVSSKKLISLLGVNDIVLVEEEDLLFLAKKQSLSEIKEMLSEFKKNQTLQKYL